MNIEIHQFTTTEAAARIRVPSKTDNKYSHGVLGVITGSKKYPGAAVLGVEAAHRTGIGMVRFLGPAEAADLVLGRRPEVVTVPGKVNAWLIGSGLDEEALASQRVVIAEALTSGDSVVLDAGAVGLCSEAVGPVIITPHAGELERLTPRGKSRGGELEGDADWAARAAGELGCVVLLKGNTTYVSWPQPDASSPVVIAIQSLTTWLATAGTGDVLAGIIGALVAVASVDHTIGREELAHLAATGAYIHSHAAGRAASNGPFPALDVAEAVGLYIQELLTERQ